MNRVADGVASGGSAAIASVCTAFPTADSTAAAAVAAAAAASLTSHLSTTTRQGTKTDMPNALGSHSTALGRGFQFNKNFPVGESNARNRRGSASFPAGTASGASATTLEADISPSNITTPFTAAFAIATAAGTEAVSTATGPGAGTAAAYRSQVLTCMAPSASMPTPSTSALSIPTASVPARASFASPVTSLFSSCRTRSKPPGSGGPTGAGGGRMAGERTRSITKANSFTAAPAATDAVSERRIQRLLHEIDAVCSSGFHSTISPVESSSNMLFEYDLHRDGDDGRSCDRKWASSASTSPPPSAQGMRQDEQEFQDLLMLPASSEAAARFDTTPQEEDFDVPLTAKISIDGDELKSLPMLSDLQTPSGMVDDAAASIVATEVPMAEGRELRAAAVKAEGDELANEDGMPKHDVGSDNRGAFSSNAVPALGGTEAELQTKQPSDDFNELTLCPLGAYSTLCSERHRLAIDRMGSRTMPGTVQGVNSTRGGGGGGEGAAEAGKDGNGQAFQVWDTDGNAAAASSTVGGFDAGLKVLRSSSGYGSGSLSDSDERELSLRQLARRGLADRSRDNLLASDDFSDTAVTTVVLAALSSLPPPPPSLAPRTTIGSLAESKVTDLLHNAHRHNAWVISDGASCVSEVTNGGKGGGGGFNASVPAKAVTLRRVGRKDSVEGSDDDDDDPAGFLDLDGSPVPGRSESRRRLVSSESTHTSPVVVGATRGANCKLFELKQSEGQDQEQDQQRRPQGMGNMFACRSQHWPPLQPKPPSRPRRASAQSSSVAAWAAAATTVAAARPDYPAGSSTIISSAAVAAGLDTESSAGAEELLLRRSGVPPASPLQARLFVGSGRNNRSLSEPSAVLHDPSLPGSKSAKASFSLSPPYGNDCAEDDEYDSNSESSESDFVVRHGGLTAPGGSSLTAVLTTPIAAATTVMGMSALQAAMVKAAEAATAGATRSSALQTATKLVALIDEDLGRHTPAVPVSSRTQGGQGSVVPLSPPSEAVSQSLSSPPLPMYPHPPPMLPSKWHLQQNPLSSVMATAAAATAANEVTDALQRTLCRPSQRRLSTPQQSLKHSAVGSRLETLDEEGHLKPSSTSVERATGSDISSSSGGDGGRGGGGLRIIATGTSYDGGGYRQSARDSKRQSTSSTPRHIHRRHRLTGEPGESGSNGSSNSNSSDEEYLQSLFRPLRDCAKTTEAKVEASTSNGRMLEQSSQTFSGASSAPSYNHATKDLRSSRSVEFHPSFINDSARSPVSPVLPAPAPPPSQPQPEFTGMRRPSARLLINGSAATAGNGSAATAANRSAATAANGIGTSSGSSAAITPSTGSHPIGGQESGVKMAVPLSLTTEVHPVVAAASAVVPSGGMAAVPFYDDRAYGAQGLLDVDSSFDGPCTDDGPPPLNVDCIKRDLKRLLSK